MLQRGDSSGGPRLRQYAESDPWVEFSTPEVEEKEPIPLRLEPAGPPFPVEILPRWWGSYITALAVATQTPVDLSASVSLGVMAACAAGRVRVRLNRSWTEPLNLYTVAAMAPGNRKSGVYKAVTWPLRTFEKDLIESARTDIRQQETTKKLREDRAERLRRDALKDAAAEGEYLQAVREADESRVAPAPRLMVDDATPEAIASLAASQGGRIAIASAEGGIFDIFAGRYGGAPNMEVLLKGHSGDSHVIDRKGRESERIDSLTVTMILTVQPSVLRQIGSQSVDKSRGELERFLYCLPRSHVGFRDIDAAPVAEETEQAYRERALELAARLYAVPGEPAMTLEPGADVVFRSWQIEVEHALRPEGKLGSPRLIGWGSKLVGATARFSGILHLASGHPIETPISAETMEGAVGLGRYYAGHADAAFTMMSDHENHRSAGMLLGTIRRYRLAEFSRTELMSKASRSTFPDAESLRQALGVLTDHGWVTSVAMDEREGPGRRPSPRYRAHPSALR